MQLVLGLGNPGRKYRDNRHNIGTRCVEALARELGLAFGEETPEYRAATGDGPTGPLSLLVPLTYMNRSGQAAVAWARRTGHVIEQGGDPDGGEVPDAPSVAVPLVEPVVMPIVVCDDLHLPLGSIRIRARGSDGGQNGLASVIAAVGSADVPRLRLGVGPLVAPVPPEDWADYVLEDFGPEEAEAVDDLIERGAAALADMLANGPAAAGSRHNRRIRVEADESTDRNLPPRD